MTRQNVVQRPRQRVGRLLLLVTEFTQQGHDLADDERQRDEQTGDDHARQGVNHPNSKGLDPAAQQALGTVQHDQHQPGDHRRDGKRQVNEAVGQPLAPESMPHQHQGECHPKHSIDGCRQGRDLERQAEGAQGLGRSQRCQKQSKPTAERPRREGRRGHQDQEREPTEHSRDEQPRAQARRATVARRLSSIRALVAMFVLPVTL